MSTSIDMLRTVQKSAALNKEEALKRKALAEFQQQENEERTKMEIEKRSNLFMTKYRKLWMVYLLFNKNELMQNVNKQIRNVNYILNN